MERGRAALEGFQESPEGWARLGVPGVTKRSSVLDILSNPAFGKVTLADLVRRVPSLQGEGGVSEKVASDLEADARYSLFVDRQAREIERMRKRKRDEIPRGVDYNCEPIFYIPNNPRPNKNPKNPKDSNKPHRSHSGRASEAPPLQSHPVVVQISLTRAYKSLRCKGSL